MELCSSDLRIWLHELKFFSEQLNNSIIFQISQGIQYLHEKKFIHRNLKPENIFFDAKNKKCVKIGDFKFNDAHRYDTSTTRNKGTLNYMAPEQDADKNSYNNPEVDLFALGIILMELYLAPNIIASRQQTKFSSIVNGLKVQKVTPDTIDRYPIVVDIILCLTKFEPRERENKIGQLDPKNKSNGFPGKVFSGRSNTGHHVVPNQKLIEAKKMYEKEMDNQLQTAQKKFIEPQELKEIHKKVSRHVFKQMNILPRDEDIYHNVLYTTFNVYLFKNEKNIPSPPALGIVLGTTYSCVAIYHNGSVEIIPDNNGDKIIPSFVSFGTCEILVGMPAKEQAHKFPETTIFDAKRLIGRKFEDPNIQRDANLWPFKVVNDRGNPSIEIRGENHVPESISAKILFQLAKMAEDYLHQKITRAVITVPAYFNDGQRQATRDAGEIAGLEVLAIIDEPSSAAIAYQLDSLQNEDEKIILIFDLGGGTFDISILRAKYSTMKVITKIGDTYLGGEDFDSKMVEWCVEKFVKKEKLDPSEGLNSTDEMTKSYASRRLRRLRNKCEEAKRKLSMGQEAWIKLHAFQNGIDFSECMTRNEFEVMNLDKFQRTIELVGKALQDAKLTKDQIDDIVLVGGSTKIPKIQELLCTFFNGKTLKKSIQVDEVVARGAAIKAALLNGNIDSKIKNIQIADVTPFSLGIELEGGEFSKIIAKNTPIPTLKRSPLFTNIEDMQENACISIYEGEDKVANKNYLLGEFFLILAKKKEGEEKIEVQMEINGDGILKVTAISLDAGHENEITIQEHRGRLSRAEILEIKMKEDVGVKNEDLLKSLSESGKIDGELLKNLKFNPSRRSNVMVSFKNGQTTPVINEIASKFGPETSGPEKAYAIKSGLGSFSAQSQSSTLNYLSNVPATSFSNFESFWISNQLLIRGATAPLITALSIQPNIANVAEEKKTHLIDGVINSELIQNPRQSNGLQWGVDKVRAQMAWDAGYRGQGIIVAVIDTGTRMTHQILRNNYVGRENNGWLDATFNPRNWWSRPSQDPTDDQGHGTHCTGSITGTNGYGVAPDAKWMACKALNAAGSGTQSDLLECMQFTLCPTKPDGSGADCSKKPHIVSNSWGGSSDEVDPKYEDAINAWRNADIIPVFAAGNSGEDGCSTMGSPGASKNVIAVGATDRNDAIASFSSRGPVKGNRLMKPEISAPGVDINSAGHQRDTAYRVMSGTSMACPHVAGLVALQLSRDPNLKYNDILNAMTYNAEKQSLTKGSETCDGKSQSEFPNNHFGNGRIDAFMTLMNDVPSK